jgi:hypothetical protein
MDPGSVPMLRTTRTTAGLVTAAVLGGLVTLPALAAEPAGPAALADTAVTTSGAIVTVDVLANDVIPDAGRPVVTVSSPPQSGAAEVAGESVRYTAAASFVGEDTFGYTVTDATGATASATVTVAVDAPTNTAPLAVDDAATALSGTPMVVPVLVNDTDGEGDPLAVAAVSDPGHGTATPVPGGVEYTTDPGFTGVDSFSYRVTDPAGATAEATVTVTVTLPPGVRDVVLTAPSSVVVRRTATLTGTVPPVGAGPVSVQLEWLSVLGWRSWATSTAAADGTARFSYVPTGPGTLRWRTVAVWPDGSAAVSAERTMTVVLALDAVVSGALSTRDVPYSYRSGCPVPPSRLRTITLNHWDYRGRVGRGTLVVHSAAVADLLSVFGRAFAARFPIRQIVPADAFYGGGAGPAAADVRAMAAGNTSAFNCRPVVGNPYRMSQHSYGNAIDINTIENPYVVGSRVYPTTGRPYLKRSPYRTGMIVPGGPVATGMAARGWLWGIRWASPDYQHFSSNGG